MSEIMEVLLRFKKQLVKEVDHHGRTPLYYGAINGDRKTVQRLLKIDTSIAYVLDREGHSPIHVAAIKGHTSVIKEIIQHCPDAGELTDLFGQNALHSAVIAGQANVVKYILGTKELEGLLNQPDIDGNTPMHLAAIERKTWILRYT
ncbi:Transmembrane protein [Trema orientale]|uniref:Transmembrane protein n=1 Tax=Trema orientale TaxID=63057 RepID=A0A2P5FRS8_TREOI|nr:Transmembrane protein [Trema orientale]